MSHWFCRSRGSILNFRVGFLSLIGRRLPYSCLRTPFPILRFSELETCRDLSGTSDSQRDSRESIRASFALETPLFIARQTDSHESLAFPSRENHPIRANRANRFARITPLRSRHFRGVLSHGIPLSPFGFRAELVKDASCHLHLGAAMATQLLHIAYRLEGY